MGGGGVAKISNIFWDKCLKFLIFLCVWRGGGANSRCWVQAFMKKMRVPPTGWRWSGPTGKSQMVLEYSTNIVRTPDRIFWIHA